MNLNFIPYPQYRIMAEKDASEPIVTDFINRKEFVILSGAAKTGKSYFAINLAISIASGKRFLNFDTVKGKVFYLQTEISSDSLKERIDPVLATVSPQNEESKQNIFICDERIRIDKEEDRIKLKSTLETERPCLLILDPFYTLHNLKEDSSNDMAPILTFLKHLASDSNCAILLIHHQGKRNEANANVGHGHRGSSSFADVPDSSLCLFRKSKGLSLHAEFRNRRPIEPLHICTDENQVYVSIVEDKTLVDRRSVLIERLKSVPGHRERAAHLRYHFVSKTDLTPASFNKYAQELVASGRILLEGEGKDTFYKLVDE